MEWIEGETIRAGWIVGFGQEDNSSFYLIATETSSGLCSSCSSIWMKFLLSLLSYRYRLLSPSRPQSLFYIDLFFVHDVTSPNFGPTDRVKKRHNRGVPPLDCGTTSTTSWPSHILSYTSMFDTNRLSFDIFKLALVTYKRACWISRPSFCLRNPSLLRFSLKISFTSRNSLLVLILVWFFDCF